MSRAIFNATSGGTVTLDAQDTVDNKVLVIPAANGTLLYDDGTGTQTFDNVVVTGNATIASGQIAATAVDPTDIARRTGHGLDAVDRYIKSYNRVKELYRKAFSREEIKKVTGFGLKTIDQYLRIALQFHTDIKEKWQDTTKK